MSHALLSERSRRIIKRFIKILKLLSLIGILLILWCFLTDRKPQIIYQRFKFTRNILISSAVKFEKFMTEIFSRNNVKQGQDLPKLILMYNPLYWWEDWVNDTWETSNVFRNCPMSNCVLSKNISLFNISDAVIFKVQDLKDLPLHKTPNQVWIFAQFEPPKLLHRPDVYKQYRNLVNWTLGYRRDSDFTVTYGYFKKLRKPNMSVLNMTSKSKMAIIFKSHCGTHSKREVYIKLLSKVIPIDEYGKCKTAKFKCGERYRFNDAWNMKNKTSSYHKDCFSVLDTDYKFYLSFENSLCKDYVTEKGMHMVVKHGIVPVFWGGANYSLYYPRDSYIDTQSSEMANYKAVAAQLQYLSTHEESYKSYFHWRKYFYTVGMLEGWNKQLCDLCKRLHDTGNNQRLYSEIYNWMYQDGYGDVCYAPYLNA